MTIPPSAMGVPVATTPGFVPHCDVLTVVLLELGVGLLAGVLPLPLPLLLLLLQPAITVAPIAASAMVARAPDMRLYIPNPHLLVVKA